MSREYCRNCGAPNDAVTFALPGLCEACHDLPATGEKYSASTGERLLPEPLQAVSNVIELKPEHKYLLVFNQTHYGPEQLNYLARQLCAMEYQCFCVATYDNDGEIQVIEVPNEQ